MATVLSMCILKQKLTYRQTIQAYRQYILYSRPELLNNFDNILYLTWLPLPVSPSCTGFSAVCHAFVTLLLPRRTFQHSGHPIEMQSY